MKSPLLKLFSLMLCALILEGCKRPQETLSYEIGDAEVAITGCDGAAAGEVAIPDEIEGLPVTSIGDMAFLMCSCLTSITIPEGVTSIGENAFLECGSLTSITVASGNSNYKSLDGVIFSKDDKDLLVCPAGKSGHYSVPESVTSIGRWAFSGCNSLSSITIPDSVTSIGDSAFSRCTSLTEISVTPGNASYKSIDGVVFSKDDKDLLVCPAGKSGDYTIPDSVTSIGDEAFSDCKSLISITIAEGLTSIEYRAFYQCTSLTEIPIPDSVTSIGSSAFWGCSSLTEITIPDGVSSIGDYAFYSCSSLTSISIPQAFHSEAEASRLGLDGLWPDGFLLPNSAGK